MGFFTQVSRVIALGRAKSLFVFTYYWKVAIIFEDFPKRGALVQTKIKF